MEVSKEIGNCISKTTCVNITWLYIGTIKLYKTYLRENSNTSLVPKNHKSICCKPYFSY